MKLTRAARLELAEKRLIVNLRAHIVANARTLEQKISDGGPYNQRIDPHILTQARNTLVSSGRINATFPDNVPWYHLADADPAAVAKRLAEQLAVYRELHSGSVQMRAGQALEIATYRALRQVDNAEFWGRYRNLDDHDDSTMYSKEEPPGHIGNYELPGDHRLDFLLRHPTAGHLGIECKNIRPWLYPDDSEISELLLKCVRLHVVPVLIARRIPYVTFMLFTTCGVIMHQTYNQRLPASDAAIVALAKDKNLLGYHDIRLGNDADARLVKFITVNMPAVADDARAKFERYYDLLSGFASDAMNYQEFAGRVRRRSRGEPEDFDVGAHPPFENF